MKKLDFSAYEVNELRSRARKSTYYVNAYNLVMSFLDGNPMTEKQLKWLWGIKVDLKDDT